MPNLTAGTGTAAANARHAARDGDHGAEAARRFAQVFGSLKKPESLFVQDELERILLHAFTSRATVAVGEALGLAAPLRDGSMSA
jgi:hypothetical protein